MARLRMLTLLAGQALLAGLVSTFFVSPALCQVLVVDTQHPISIDRRYMQVQPTSVPLPQQQIDARGHQDLLRSLEAEQGFAMRPFPRGKKGMTLVANGKLSPANQSYVNAVNEQGLSVKPGERVVLSNIRIDKDRIVFDINGGPEHKHEFLRHIQIGVGGPNMSTPIVQDDGQEPVGSRITLSFEKYVPEVTPTQVKALLAPLISFDVKTPVQAYTDTLPPRLKEAILNHRVMVGMNTEMVLFAMGQPEKKSREIEGQMPFEEWIYGHAPQDVQFVRINGNRVIRVALAKLGQPLEVSTKDEVEGLMTTDGKPALAEVSGQTTRTVHLGDDHPDLDKQAPKAPPTLRGPGEKLPSDEPGGQIGGQEGAMKPVVFPKDTTNAPARTVDAHPDKTKPDAAQDATTPAATGEPTGPSDDKTKPGNQPPTAPAQPVTTPPASNLYSGRSQPALL
jgi:hypothetical protein